MHLFHPTDKIHFQGDALVCPFCHINLKTQDRETLVSRNVKTILGAIGVVLILCISYVYVRWEEFIPRDTQGLASIGIVVMIALGLIYGYLKWRRSSSYIPVMGTR